MATDSVRTRTSVTVQLADGRSQPYGAGKVIKKSDLAPHLLEKIEGGDAYTSALFEPASSDDAEEEYYGDHNTRGADEAEAVARERATGYTIEERLGGHIPERGDPDRTKPISGSDIETDKKYAANEGDDTSENLPPERAEAEDLSQAERLPSSSAPRVGDIEGPGEPTAPRRRSRRRAAQPEPEAEASDAGEGEGGQ